MTPLYYDPSYLGPSDSETEIVQGFDEADVERIAAAVIEGTDLDWAVPDQPFDLGSSIRWQPRLASSDHTICHIQVTPTVSRAWLKRMRAAAEADYQIYVAAPLEYWYSADTLTVLSQLDVKTIVLEPVQGEVTDWVVAGEYRSVAKLIAMTDLIIGQDLLFDIGIRAFDRALDANENNEKGRLFEDFLCLLFSQVSFFKVFANDYENDTQEIDLVLLDRRVDGGPIALVSAKNTPSESVGQKALNSLRTKMSHRRGQCKLGFLCAAHSVAKTVKLEEMRYSTSDSVVVVIDGKTIQHLLHSTERLDEEFSRLIVEAALA